MSNILLVLFTIFLFFIFIFLLFIYKKKNNRPSYIKSFSLLKSTASQKENSPDINTSDWYLHKNRLIKYGRSQYKGLTFFVSAEDRIYYLSEKGTKVYC